jgi:LPXTG-motif cell wall-anchored protein
VGENLITDAEGCTDVVDQLNIAETYTVHVSEVPEGYTAPQDKTGTILDQDDPIEIPLVVSKTATSKTEATTQQETSQQTTAENTNDTAAETGDSFDGMLAVTMLLLAAALIGLTAYRKRKNEKK